MFPINQFPCLPTWGNIVADTKFVWQEANMSSNKLRNIFVTETMFPGLPTCFQMFLAQKACAFPNWQRKTRAIINTLK